MMKGNFEQMGFLQFDVFLAFLYLWSPFRIKKSSRVKTEMKRKWKEEGGVGSAEERLRCRCGSASKGEDMTSASSEFKSSTIVDVEVRYVFDI